MAREAGAPNKAPAVARIYEIATVQTPRRDVDLFGPTTVRIDSKREAGSSGVPVVYLSAYVEDPDRFAQRLAAALSWLADDRTPEDAAQPVSLYSLPEFVEDVDWSVPLFLPEDVLTTDWKAWSEAFVCRVRLATTARQIAALLATNAEGLKACPYRQRAGISQALTAAYDITHDQAAAA
jgi:hypothetical protein